MRPIQKAARQFKPPPKLTVSQWADENRQLSSESSSEPGQWITARAEYQRGIMDAVSDPAVEDIVIMSSAQVGKTEIVNNIVGYFIDQDPAPILLLQPTIQMGEAWSKDRLAPMIRDTAVLADKIQLNNRRNSANTLLHKAFPGGHITIAGANSPASLASRPIRVVLGDEVDRYPASAGTEGDPVNLAKKRTTTFWNRKKVWTSTPTVKGASRIEIEYEQSDQRRYFVPCPDCDHYQHLKWGQVKWVTDEDGTHQTDTAGYCCEECGSLWNDGQRLAAIAKGEWRATAPFNGRAGFHLNELYSPWVPMGKVVRAFLEAKGNPETLKTWVNTSLGETWEEAGENIDKGNLYARRESYTKVPDGGLLLTAGVDIQRDRIELEVVAWGEGEESWSVDYLILPGDTSRPEVWQELDDCLQATYTHESGTELHITAVGIDSGDQTTTVYGFVKPRSYRRIFALKGIAGPGRPVVKVSRRQKGRATRDVDLYQVGVDDAKGIIYARLKIEEPGPGYCHFPLDRDEEYFDQLTAEKLVTKFRKGFPHKEWQKVRARNEALDCRVYAFAALKILNPVWTAIEKRLQPKEAPAEPELRRTTQKPRPVRRRKNWATDI